LGVQAPNDFSTLFIKPIQRFPRYELLGRELVQNSEEHKVFNRTAKKFQEQAKQLCVQLNKSGSILDMVKDFISNFFSSKPQQAKIPAKDIKEPPQQLGKMASVLKQLEELNKNFKDMDQNRDAYLGNKNVQMISSNIRKCSLKIADKADVSQPAPNRPKFK
jgi:chromatin segregation and condensation protein Rec8/ScpA/Scc1 (kleisin family)